MKFFLLLLLFLNSLSATEKIALLIGNTDYKFQPLSNPINDVRAIKKTLIEIGFKEENIVVLENASREEMMNALRTFRAKGKKAEIALVYFSGHGMQVNNSNYMFPANTTATTSLDLEGLVNLNSLIDSTTTAKYGIILVDACRTNPLVDNFQDGRHKGSTAKKGLGKVTIELEKIIISFPTRAGSLAEDGEGDNSPYAKALIKNLKLNLDIRPILSQVGRDVYNATKNHIPPQNPIYEDTLGRESICLTGICTGEHNQTRGEEAFVEPELENIGRIDRFMYQIEPSLGRFTWKEAQNYCQKLKLKNYSNWRLPSKKELSKILKKESIKQKEIHLWTLYKSKDLLVWAIDVDENDWYRSDTPKEWKNPNLCVRSINSKEER